MVNYSVLLKEPLCILYLVPLKQFCLDHGSRAKVLKSHSFNRPSPSISQNIFPHKILLFLCGRLEDKYMYI